MSGNEVKKCPRCGSANLRKKNVKLARSAEMFNPLEARTYICSDCGYIEFYER